MTFAPNYCPNPSCEHHRLASFPWRRRGTYRRQCDGRDVQRFECLGCRKTFSIQTFRVDYRLRIPKLHFRVFELLCSKVTLRQMARVLGVKRRTVERRLDLLGKHCAEFHSSRLARCFGELEGQWSLDEAETYEHNRKLKPVTVAVLIERKTGFVVHTRCAPLPPRRPLNAQEEARLAQIEAVEGKRLSGSKKAVDEAFGALDKVVRKDETILVITDKKHSYRRSIREVMTARVHHQRVSSKVRRDTENPLFRINHTLAMMRDGLSRLVRRTWAASKIMPRLDTHLAVWNCFRNYIRPMTNREDRVEGCTAAMALGVEDWWWTVVGLLRWRVAPGCAAWCTARGTSFSRGTVGRSS